MPFHFFLLFELAGDRNDKFPGIGNLVFACYKRYKMIALYVYMRKTGLLFYGNWQNEPNYITRRQNLLFVLKNIYTYKKIPKEISH